MILDMSVRASVISVLLLSTLLVVGCGRDDHPIHGTYTAIQFEGRPLPYNLDDGLILETARFEVHESGDCALWQTIVYEGEEEDAESTARLLSDHPLTCTWEIDGLGDGDGIRLRLFETGGPNSNPDPSSSEEAMISNGLLSIGRDWIFQKD